MKILSVFGTRPEAIKMAPVVKALAADPHFEARVCVTAQHRQMLDSVLDLFGIHPDFDLDLMRPDQSLNDLTAGILGNMADVFAQWRPDLVLVHGDTTTAIAVALSAYHAKIAVGHVEAGLRTGNKYAPWPEEMNRRLTDVLADVHFAPTRRAYENLVREGVSPACVHLTGNTVIDALMEVDRRIANDTALQNDLAAGFPFLDAAKRLVLVTGHRRENFGRGLERICQALATLATRDDVQIVYPVHLNPHVMEPVHRLLANTPHVYLIPPQEYLPFIYLLRRCALVLTDSGGIQEEAPALGKPVLVMRDTTERTEAAETGAVRLVGTEQEAIVRTAAQWLDAASAGKDGMEPVFPYGNGTAARRIVHILKTGYAA